MNKKFWMAGFLVIPKVYAVIASPFNLASLKLENYEFVTASLAIPLKYALYTPQNAFAYTGNEILMEKQQTPP